MRSVLVLDANQRSALAIIRSLGMKGLRVVAADYIEPSLGSASRYASDSARYTDPARDPARFVNDIAEMVGALGICTIMPATDVTTMLLVEQRDRMLPALVAAPSAESYESVSDKRALVSMALELNVPVPETRVAWTSSEIELAARDLGYPLVLKPARSRYLQGNRIFTTAVKIVDDEHLLAAALQQVPWLPAIPCLVQRFIPGHGAGIFAICGDQGPLAWFAHQRIREKPPSGGVSVLSQSVAVNSSMQASAARLLSASRWRGVAMVEYRMAHDGTPYLMEVNGRFWGSLQLAVDSGVDFPWMSFQLANGESPLPVSSYVTGRRLRWLLGDVDNLLLQIRNPRTDLTGKARAAGRFLKTFLDTSCRQEVFRWRDPGPGLREISDWIRAVVR
jgi:predicted ATP-grasp superfamily ATP-dependent carboligase